MKMLALSDTHGRLPDLELAGIDRVLIAGDVCPTTNHSPKFQRRWLEQLFCPWVESLKIPVYLALGNHDFIDDFPAPMNLYYGTNRTVDDVFLFSWVPHFYDWAWMSDDGDIHKRLESTLAEDSPPIWVTHGPPYGVCDEVGSRHCGSTALRHAIIKYSPKLVICGHLHEGVPEGWIGDGNKPFSVKNDNPNRPQANTRVLNVSVVDDRYISSREPIVIDFP